jgi:hypothetical protein
MSKKSRVLIISGIVLVAIALLLIFSPIFKSKPITIEPGLTYQDTIMAEDTPDSTDKDYRRHTYSLTVAVNTTYTFEASSLTYASILVFEYHDGDKIQILRVDAMGTVMKNYTFHSAGLKIFYVEALADECPAEYSLRVTRAEEDS